MNLFLFKLVAVIYRSWVHVDEFVYRGDLILEELTKDFSKFRFAFVSH